MDIRMGFLQDHMLYNQSIQTNSNQLLVQANFGRSLTDNLKANIGGSLNRIDVDTDNYEGKIHENRWDLHGWIKYQPVPHWKLSMTLRSIGTDSIDTPLSPSFGSEFILKRTEDLSLKWNVLASRNFRIPTLNDRYWNPGGNPDLKMEEGFSVETGLDMEFIKKSYKQITNVSVFKMWVNNWIIWLPQGPFWSPENLREVEVSGVEISTQGTFSLGKVENNWTTAYSFTRSKNMTAIDRFDRSAGKQLPYVPFHNLSISLNPQLDSWYSKLITT